MSFQVDESDKMTANLARLLLVMEIASQALACFMVLEMVERGKLTYLINWHWQQWKRRREDEMKRSRDWHLALGRMLFEAERIVKEPTQ